MTPLQSWQSWQPWQLWLLFILGGLLIVLLLALTRLMLGRSRQVNPSFVFEMSEAYFKNKTNDKPLHQWQVVDLTQPLTSLIPIWPHDPPIEISPWATYAKDGYFIHRLTIGEHSGTHWGTANTFTTGATSTDQVPIHKLVSPAVVIDIRSQARQDPDYRLSIADIQTWETINGPVPANSMVILWTGWHDRWHCPTAFLNQDEQQIMHWPGFSTEAADFLVAQRQITGLGTDTHGVDPGNDQVYGASAAIYAADGMTLECLGGLVQLPPIGATIVVGGLPIQGGAGSPARVIAFLPPA